MHCGPSCAGPLLFAGCVADWGPSNDKVELSILRVLDFLPLRMLGRCVSCMRLLGTTLGVCAVGARSTPANGDGYLSCRCSMRRVYGRVLGMRGCKMPWGLARKFWPTRPTTLLVTTEFFGKASSGL